MSRCAPVTSGPMSHSAAVAGADGQPGDPLGDLARPARRRPGRPRPRPRSPCSARRPSRSPALTAASAARSRSASGSTTMWFFAPPSACTRLPCAVPRLVDVAGDRGGADEATPPCTSGCASSASTAVLVAVHDVEHAVGQPGLGPQLGQQHRAPTGPSRDGLSTNVLPHAIAIGNEPHRHHRREVERGDHRDHAERLPDRVRRRPRSRRSRENPPLSRCGMPQANSTTSRPRGTSPARVGDAPCRARR